MKRYVVVVYICVNIGLDGGIPCDWGVSGTNRLYFCPTMRISYLTGVPALQEFPARQEFSARQEFPA